MGKIQVHTPHKKVVSAGERRLSLFILGALAVIAAGMLIIQARFDPGDWREQAGQVNPVATARNAAAAPADATQDKAGGLMPVSETEYYDANTLSDKIDGKADLYLSAGFKRLSTRRFSLAGDKNRWMERFVYDMGDLRNAFAVFSAQRRPNARPLAWGPYAYMAGNGLFFAHGPDYVEIIASEATPEIQKAMNVLAAAFVDSHAGPTEELAELKLFPPEQRVNDSIALAAHSAFGIEGLDGVFTAAYADDQIQALAFISRRSSPEEAEASAVKFHAFWLEFGGEEAAPPVDLPGVRIVKIMDNYEICRVQGDYLFGVHEAADLAFGLNVVKQLQRSIAGQAR